jgi:NADPH:quinone reductase-like Zn-dependent oxidoreductase
VPAKLKADKTSLKVKNAEGFDLWGSTARWYTKWHDEGLCFGPYFKSLTTLRTDSARQRQEAIATAKVAPNIASGPYEFYPVHPITIDAGLQAACLSGTAGQVSALKAWVPVFISSCHIQPSATSNTDAECEIHVQTEEMGFSSRRIDGTVWDPSGIPIVDFKDSRISLYTGKNAITTAQASDTDGTNSTNALDMYKQRQPTLRVQWKPDVSRLYAEGAESLRQYVADFVERQDPDIQDDQTLAVIGALLELAGHKNPRMRVLEVDGDAHGYKAKMWLDMLGKNTAFSLCHAYHSGTLSEDGELSIKDGVEGPFDVVVIPRHATMSSHGACEKTQDLIASLVTERGIVVARKSDAVLDTLQKAGFETLTVAKQVIMAVRPLPVTLLECRNVFIVHSQDCSSIIREFSSTLGTFIREKVGAPSVTILPLGQINSVDVKPEDVCISLLETEREFLATMTPEGMDSLRVITNTVSDLLWLTGANMLSNKPDPNLTLSSGLSRALMLEQPTLRWSVMDIGSAQEQLVDKVKAKNVCLNVLKALVPGYDKDDCEFISVNGLLNVSRYTPDFEVNSLFRQRLDPQEPKAKKTLAEIGPARLAIERPGVPDTMYFQQLRERDEAPPAGYVDIQLKAVGLNAKDVYAMSGRVETREKTTGFDFSGIVTAVGPGIEHSRLKVGDRVVAYAPFHIGTTARVPVGCVHQLLDHEEFTVVPTLLLVYATALYALNDRAHLRPGESVLIHAGSGGVGVAAITLALNMGATVYTTCGSDSKREYLINELGMNPAHVFSSRDASFVQGIMEATNHRGVDVILNSLVGDLMHDGWESCLADFGRFVEIGKRELLDAGRLDMRVFLRGCTFTAFDLSELFHSKDPYQRAIWDRLMVETLDLYRAGKIQAPPVKVFDVTQLSQAYRFFANKDRVGKVVISMENPQARVPVAPSSYLSLFDPEKVYLLIGCLGGLGRSLSRWMRSRGAQHFMFLGRSGADKPSARQLVTRLEQTGATVGVVRGDVSQAADVEAAVQACVATGKKIGGVIQAAMGLHEALFTRMPNEAWYAHSSLLVSSNIC